MKVEINSNGGIKHPCLMEDYDGNERLLVLMTSEGCGTVMVGRACWSKGEYHDGWNMERLEPFNGSITLSND